MGLSIEVGIVADLLEHDEEGAEHFQEEFAILSRYLTSIGLQPHIEPTEVTTWSTAMGGYSGIHYLRRLAAHLQYLHQLPSPGDGNAARDPLLGRYFEDFSRTDPRRAFGGFDHLIIHSDAEGYYIPQDFPRVLIPGDGYPIAGGMIGSSQRLRKECELLAAALELPLNLDPEDDQVYEAAESQGTAGGTWQRYGIESLICLRLYHAASYSIVTGAAAVFT